MASKTDTLTFSIGLPELTIPTLLAAYREGSATPRALLGGLVARLRAGDPQQAWITVLDDAALAPYLARLEAADPASLPLYGVPFAIKDNIDLAGIPTTAGCPAYAYTPARSAFVVQRLLDAGAVPLGKTNLDQFATGLVGTRSPYGTCANAFDPAYIAGGSSAGSAVAVALGQVSFSLGTDTAGSGRVPASFNNILGLKPTRGRLSATGVVPACRSLDTVSIFAATAGDAQRVLDVAGAYDGADGYARPEQAPVLGPGGIPETGFRFGVPGAEQLEFFGNKAAQALFAQAVERLVALGGKAVPLDFAPFLEAARLLYEGPWVAERYAAIREFIEAQPEALFPVTREIIGGGAKPLAADAFAAQYRLADLRRRSEAVWDGLDFAIAPTAGTIYTIAEVQGDPVQLNSNLGTYTNFMNLLDLSAVAVPAGFLDSGLPWGVTLYAPAFMDQALLAMADRLHRAADLPLGATGLRLPAAETVRDPQGQSVSVAVCGAHMDGLPLNHQLQERGARLVAATRTAPVYRFHALSGGPPARPGLLRVSEGGASIEVEVWRIPAAHFGSFVAAIPPPLAIGKVLLADGQAVSGFLCESAALDDAQDITALGSWRAYLATQP